jgi:nitrogen regulatory protein P-II 1
MKRIDAIIRGSQFDKVKDALDQAGLPGMTLVESRGLGRQKGHTEFHQGSEYRVDFVPKTALMVVVPDRKLDEAVSAIVKAARTGKIGDGKIFVSDVLQAVRIRTAERGELAL